MTTTVDTIERLLCERYNVGSLDGIGALSGAIAAARGGDLGALRAAIAGRELYRWRGDIEAALEQAEAEAAAEPEPEARPKRQSRARKDAPPEPEPESPAEADEAGEADGEDQGAGENEEGSENS